MSKLEKRIEDKRVLKLIQKYLESGVMKSIKKFIEAKLKLKVNESKSAVDEGFSHVLILYR